MVIIPIVAVALFVVFGWPDALSPLSPPLDRDSSGQARTSVRWPFASVPLDTDVTSIDEVVVKADCPVGPVPEDVPLNEVEVMAQIRATAARLSTSRDAETLLAAALMSGFESSERQLALLEQAAGSSPTHPLIAWNRLRICREGKDVTCDFPAVEASAIRVDGDNGAVWMQIAMLRLDKGDQDAAAEAVRHAITAPRFDHYFIDHALLFERALSTLGGSSYTERVISGIGYSAAMLVGYYGITEHCGGASQSDSVWIELCDQLGAKMLADSKDLLDQSLGTSLRKIAARQSGNDEQYAKALAREAEFKRRYLSFTASRDAHVLLENDEAALRRYIENFSIYGERVALTRLRTEAERLKNSPDYDQCNFVSRGLLTD